MPLQSGFHFISEAFIPLLLQPFVNNCDASFNNERVVVFFFFNYLLLHLMRKDFGLKPCSLISFFSAAHVTKELKTRCLLLQTSSTPDSVCPSFHLSVHSLSTLFIH